ncbi:MAG: chemotaxis protein CheB, partial [Vicinamibacterales bacterium]
MSNAQSPPRTPVCGIGASAGGVEALQQFFSALAPDLGMAYVVIVHLAPDHKSELPAILGRGTTMPVTQVGDNQQQHLEPDHVYVIAPDRKLEITDSSVGASTFDEPRGKRAAIDLFFRSLAETHEDGFAVLLSGSGSDGALGARAVRERGGLVLVQDPAEAAHGGMPHAVIAMGVADVVLPVRDLARRLGELARIRRQLPVTKEPEAACVAPPPDEEKALKDVLEALRKRTGHDFSKYKRSTVLRRLTRRLQLTHLDTIEEYATFLRTNGGEAQALLSDLLISVTAFFRDPESWNALQGLVLAPLVEHAGDGRQLRAWVPGCATGEEAYSLAMLLMEECERCQRPPNFIVFASDVDEGALAVAREGAYPHAISVDVSEARLQRFFRIQDDQCRVVPDIRDRVVFAAHNLLRDPPFSRLDVISCRNLLIYLGRDLQEQIMGVFRYAARDDGALFLGASESARNELFQPRDKRHRLFGMRPRDDGVRMPLLGVLSLPRERSTRESRLPGRVRA